MCVCLAALVHAVVCVVCVVVMDRFGCILLPCLCNKRRSHAALAHAAVWVFVRCRVCVGALMHVRVFVFVLVAAGALRHVSLRASKQHKRVHVQIVVLVFLTTVARQCAVIHISPRLLAKLDQLVRFACVSLCARSVELESMNCDEVLAGGDSFGEGIRARGWKCLLGVCSDS